MTELCDIATKNGTDKAPWGWGYTSTYFRWLAERRAEIKTILEVGVWKGASLRTWRDFFPNAKIFGFEIDPGFEVVGEDRIKTFAIDGYLAETYAGPIMQEIGAVDFFVDDALHFEGPQVKLFGFVWPHIAPGGVYAIEECHNNSKQGVMAEIEKAPDVAQTELIYSKDGYSLLLLQKGKK